MDVVFADVKENLRRMQDKMEQTAAEGARLVVFPECVVTGYCFESLEEARELAEPIPGPSVEAMTATCKRLDQHVVFGLLELDGDRLFNACVLVGPDGLVASYRKIHLPQLGVDRFTTPGDRPFAVHEVRGVRIGMNICYDGAFPEAARVMALDGADLIVLPTNWPPGAECTADYVINARAMENAVYYMSVDRIGTERGFRFIGRSKICATNGDPMAEAMHEDEAILYAEIDVELSRRKHIVRVPDKHEIDRFKDRRPEMYGRVVE
jgi:predicted amidohydrolase